MLNKLISKKNKNSESGFTIIEVLIVLAIAGLILVVVLIAIPQLQRNQRNSARQNDAARVGTSVSNWVSNNNGALIPTTPTATPVSSTVFLSDVANDLGGLSQYVINDDNANGTLLVAAGAASVSAPTDNFNNIRIVVGAACTSNGNATNDGAAPRQFVVQYQTEDNTGDPQGACLEV